MFLYCLRQITQKVISLYNKSEQITAFPRHDTPLNRDHHVAQLYFTKQDVRDEYATVLVRPIWQQSCSCHCLETGLKRHHCRIQGSTCMLAHCQDCSSPPAAEGPSSCNRLCSKKRQSTQWKRTYTLHVFRKQHASMCAARASVHVCMCMYVCTWVHMFVYAWVLQCPSVCTCIYLSCVCECIRMCMRSSAHS